MQLKLFSMATIEGTKLLKSIPESMPLIKDKSADYKNTTTFGNQ